MKKDAVNKVEEIVDRHRDVGNWNQCLIFIQQETQLILQNQQLRYRFSGIVQSVADSQNRRNTSNIGVLSKRKENHWQERKGQYM